MNAHGIQVFHVADGDDRVVPVPHDLVLDLLIALDALLHQHLVHRGQLQGMAHPFPHLLLIMGKTAAGAAQGEGRPENHRVADIFRCSEALLHGGGNLRGHYRLTQGLAELLELLPVLGPADAGGIRPQKLYLALLEHSLLIELQGEI